MIMVEKEDLSLASTQLSGEEFDAVTRGSP